MKWIEYMVAGLAGGAIGFYALTAATWQGSMANMVFIATLSFGSNMPMMLISSSLGLAAGDFTKSIFGALVGGALVPLGYAVGPYLLSLAG